jgi:hypothetical protein
MLRRSRRLRRRLFFQERRPKAAYAPSPALRAGADLSSKQPQAFRAFERAERQERAQRPASPLRLRPFGRRHGLLALPITRVRNKTALRATATRMRAIAPIFQQRTLRLRQIRVPLAVRQHAPLLQGHAPWKAPRRRAQLSSHRFSLLVAARRDGSSRHCEKRQRRSNPASAQAALDCFADARNDATEILLASSCPAKRGRGTALRSSVVEGASASLLALPPHAPSTTLRRPCFPRTAAKGRLCPLPRTACGGG